MIPYSRQNISYDDINAVSDVLRSDFLTQGPVTRRFESAVAQYCGASHAIATVNATAALHVAMLLCDVSDQDIVWVPAISFVATANCARYCDATVTFLDCEKDTGLLALNALDEKLVQADKAGLLPKVLVVVHLAGHSVDMERVHELCNPYDIRVVEDASHALSGEYKGRRIGCCLYSDYSIFSFHPVKPVTSGEGGMLVTNHTEVVERARRLIEHGIERNIEGHLYGSKGPWYYEQQDLGFNYRLSDIHAALGLSQLSRLDGFLLERERLASHYSQRLSEGQMPLTKLAQNPDCRSSWHLYVVQCQDQEFRDKFLNRLRKAGFGANLHYMPIPAHPYYIALGMRMTDFPNAQAYAETSLSLPLFPGLQVAHIDTVLEMSLEL